MIALLPFAVHFSSWQAAAATHSARSIPSTFLWECHGCRSHGASVHLQPCDYSSQRRSTRRGGSITVSFTQDNGDMFSVVAACLPIAGCRPPSLQCGMADGGPSPCKRVDVQ
ncbi:hypothetical protein TcG_11997 [Trypanosoma cruzi]|nr:hypothetical protein TcG_11997 [Trypanosoma cruzi]